MKKAYVNYLESSTKILGSKFSQWAPNFANDVTAAEILSILQQTL